MSEHPNETRRMFDELLDTAAQAEVLDLVVTLAVAHAARGDTRRLAASVESMLEAFPDPGELLGAAVIQAAGHASDLARATGSTPDAVLRSGIAARHRAPYDLLAYDSMLAEMRATPR